MTTPGRRRRKRRGKWRTARNPQAERRARRQEPTLEKLWEHWLLYAEAHKKPLSVNGDRLNYAKHLAKWKNRRLSAIRKTDVQALHSEIGASSGPYAANRVLALLRAMLNKADELGYRGTNPAARITKFREQSRDRFLQPHEMERFMVALAAEKSIFRDFFVMCLLTGARKNNVQTMAWADVDLDGRFWKIPETKAGMAVIVPLVPAALEILKMRQVDANGCPYVFPGRRRGDHLREPRETWKHICAAAGLSDLHIHDLRRSLGSWMAGQNVSLQIIGKALGHRTPQATAIYSRLSLDPVRAAVEGAATAMLTAGKQTKLLATIDTESTEAEQEGN